MESLAYPNLREQFHLCSSFNNDEAAFDSIFAPRRQFSVNDDFIEANLHLLENDETLATDAYAALLDDLGSSPLFESLESPPSDDSSQPHPPDALLDDIADFTSRYTSPRSQSCSADEKPIDKSSIYESLSEIVAPVKPSRYLSTLAISSPSTKYALSRGNANVQYLESRAPLQKRNHSSTPDEKVFNKRRKTVHLVMDEALSPVSYYDSSSDISVHSTLNVRKKLSNREAAHRYRQKIKSRENKLDEELDDSFKYMNQAKQAYEKALESFTLLQRVVQDLTSARG